MTPERQRRMVFAIIALAAVGVIGISLWLKPDPRGYGTHEALGLPPCGLKFITDIPCPSCGMTTSFAYAARLEVRKSFQAHPCGLALFCSVVLVGLVSATGFVASRSSDRLEQWAKGFPWWGVGISFFTVFLFIWVWRVLEVLLS